MRASCCCCGWGRYPRHWRTQHSTKAQETIEMISQINRILIPCWHPMSRQPTYDVYHRRQSPRSRPVISKRTSAMASEKRNVRFLAIVSGQKPRSVNLVRTSTTRNFCSRVVELVPVVTVRGNDSRDRAQTRFSSSNKRMGRHGTRLNTTYRMTIPAPIKRHRRSI